MALIPVHKVVHTLLGWFESERGTFNTIVDQYYQGKQINFFKGLRKVFKESSLPAIEVGPTDDAPSWEFVRVQGDSLNLEIHITTSNFIPEAALDLESKLASFVTRILCYPPNIRGRIEGTNTWFQDSFPKGIQYGAAGYTYNIRVSKIQWGCKVLEYLSDASFPPVVQEGGDHFAF